MNEPRYKLIEGKADTVGELIEILKKVPEDYDVSVCGNITYGILMDTENKGILLDDVNFIEELIGEENSISSDIEIE